ncbi:hypothetical protein BESB_048290 [Besnoitia besnoiti]|uniref:Uncharacterized protein n=1 Tax=Besnoitia besnoiti TaxID=94643 RepID=A0A2A9MLS2_BESBE|nr:hypothetical protein BESB_048290 [Besnoitia besnoiti]PFH36637.1 hypothetical protein BESB_048290 [Besnoitia besnoiti]
MGNVVDTADRLDPRFGVLTTPDGKKRSMRPEDCRPRYYERTYRETRILGTQAALQPYSLNSSPGLTLSRALNAWLQGDPELPEDPEFPAKLLQAAQDHDWKIENGADGVSIMYPGKRQPKLWVGPVRVVNPEDKLCPENGNANLSLDALIQQGLITPVYKPMPTAQPAPGAPSPHVNGPQASQPTTATNSRQQSEEEAQMAGEEFKTSVTDAVNLTAGTQYAPKGPEAPIHPAQAIYNNIPYPLPGSYCPPMTLAYPAAPAYPYPAMPTPPCPQYAVPSPLNRPPPVVAQGPCAPLLPIF